MDCADAAWQEASSRRRPPAPRASRPPRRRSFAPQIERVGEAAHRIAPRGKDLLGHGYAPVGIAAGERARQPFLLARIGRVTIPWRFTAARDQTPGQELSKLAGSGRGTEAKL